MNPRALRWTLAAAALALWAVFGALRFDQGLDLGGQGQWVYGASLESASTAVHSVIETGDGPIRYQILGAWMRLTTPSFRAAVQVQLFLHALLAALLVLWGMRRGWFVTVAVQAALFAAAPLPFAALWAGTVLMLAGLLPDRARPPLVTGVLLAALLTQDPLWFVIVLGVVILRTEGTRRFRVLRAGTAGFAIGIALVLLHAANSGAFVATLRNALIEPWTWAFARSGQIGTALLHGAWLDRPFAGLLTGEQPGPAWPAHAFLHAWALRCAALLLLATVIAAVRAGRQNRMIPVVLAALALCALRGDLPTLALALIFIAATGGRVIERTRWRRVWACALAFSISVGCAENAWLLVHQDRAGLTRWDAPGVGVRLDAARAHSLQDAVSRLHLHDGRSALIWPDLAGLHFLLGSRPAVRWLSPTHAADDVVANVLQAGRAPAVVFAADPSLLPQNLEAHLPHAASVLRKDYRLRGSVPARGLNLRIIERGARPDDPLAARIPRVECMVAPELQTVGPALRDDVAIGQSFRIAGDDLRGFAFRLVTSADSVDVELRARVWERRGSEFSALLEARTLRFVASRSKPMQWFDFPVDDTADRDLALVFECEGTPTAEVRFAWHETADESGLGDVYTGGSAMLDLREVDADLIILIY